MSDSFLLKAFDTVTDAWVSKLSLVAIPLLRRGTRPDPALQRNRDIFVSFMLGLSIAMVVMFHVAGARLDCWRQAIAGLALYQAFSPNLTNAIGGSLAVLIVVRLFVHIERGENSWARVWISSAKIFA